MEKSIKHIIFILILAMMVLPFIQGYLTFVTEKPLYGVPEKSRPALFSMDSWMNGSYQEAQNIRTEEKLGFHSSLVRLYYQIDFSLFGKPYAKGITKGMNGQYYETDYIRSWTGEDFVGEKQLDHRLRQFRFLQQHLKDSLDIDLVLVLEPGKATVYPEDIPTRFTKAEPGASNYDYICVRADELDIKLIDFNAYFKKLKDTSQYPVFPKKGTHWSEFAMWYAADSLVNYIESVRGIDLPEIVMEGREISDSLRSSDNDIERTLNLLFKQKHQAMPYPVYSFREDSSHTKPEVLVVADSYYWNIFNTRIPKYLFAHEAFWYYYGKIYPDTYYVAKKDSAVTVKDINIQKEIEKQDVIFLMITERFLYKFDRGFIWDLYNLYGKTSSRDELTPYLNSIVLTDNWFADLIIQAKEDRLSLSNKMDLHARYMYMVDHPDQYYACYGPRVMFREIKENEAWYLSARKNAIRKDISIDEQLVEEARFAIQDKHPEGLIRYDQFTAIKDSIRHDSAWYASVMDQAKHYFMTEEEIMQAEAERVWDTMVVRDSL